MSGYKTPYYPRVVRVWKNGSVTGQSLDEHRRGEDIESQRRTARLDLALGIYREIRIETVKDGKVVTEVVA